MGLQLHDEVLEIRILGYRGRTIHRDKCSLNNSKKMANLFWTLKMKFDIDPERLLKKDDAWFKS